MEDTTEKTYTLKEIETALKKCATKVHVKLIELEVSKEKISLIGLGYKMLGQELLLADYRNDIK